MTTEKLDFYRQYPGALNVRTQSQSMWAGGALSMSSAGPLPRLKPQQAALLVSLGDCIPLHSRFTCSLQKNGRNLHFQLIAMYSKPQTSGVSATRESILYGDTLSKKNNTALLPLSAYSGHSRALVLLSWSAS